MWSWSVSNRLGRFFPFVWALPLSFIYLYIIIIIWIDSRPLVKVDKIWNVSITLMFLFSPIVASMQTSTVFSMSLSEFMSSFVSSYRSHAYNCDVWISQINIFLSFIAVVKQFTVSHMLVKSDVAPNQFIWTEFWIKRWNTERVICVNKNDGIQWWYRAKS